MSRKSRERGRGSERVEKVEREREFKTSSINTILWIRFQSFDRMIHLFCFVFLFASFSFSIFWILLPALRYRYFANYYYHHYLIVIITNIIINVICTKINISIITIIITSTIITRSTQRAHTSAEAKRSLMQYKYSHFKNCIKIAYFSSTLLT